LCVVYGVSGTREETNGERREKKGKSASGNIQ